MLSQQEQATLRNRYAGWGLDAVKHDLKRPFRWVYGSRDRNAFATEWVHEAGSREQRRRGRRKRIFGIALIALMAQVGIIIGFGLIPSAG